MKTLLPLGVSLLLVVGSRGQSSPGFYFPQQPQPPQSSNSGGGEFLGNYFNDNANLPSITTSSQPTFSSPPPQNQFRYQPQQPQTFSSGPPQFTNNLNQNYISSSPPSSSNANSIPRETHFFGNNYDFFRSFHLDAAPQRPPSFQPIQPYRPAQSFNPSVGNNHQASASPSTAPPTAASSPAFTTNQFFDNPFSTHTFSSARPTTPTITYNYINGQPVQNSLFNGYEEAAKQLGVTHGLRVFTTESIRVNPTSSVATVPQQEISSEPSSTVPAPVEDKRIDDDDALTLSPVSSTLAPSPSPSTPVTTTSPSTTPTSAPIVIIRNTGRSIATPVVRSRLISSSATPINPDGSPVSKQSSPNAGVVSHSREPLYTANASPNVVSGVDAFPGRDEEDFEQSRPQQRPQRPVTPRVAVTTREPTRPTPSPTPTPPPTTQQTRLRTTTQPPPPPPSPTFSGEKPLYNNANRLVPGQLYSNTNGAYQHYYGPGSLPQRPPMRGLEEIEPQIIDFPIPIHKMIPVLEQHFRNEEYDPYRRPLSFDNFGPPGGPSSFPQGQQQLQYRPQPRPFNPVSPPSPQQQPQPFNRPPLITQPEAPVVIVTESSLPNLSTPPSTNSLEETVVRVGPKGRLLKKRRKVRPQSAQVPQQQRSATTEVRPTTYRPPVEEVEQGQNQNQEEPAPATTYRSRFRFSPTTATTTTESPSAAATSEGDKSLIASRLKSVERQIRFRHRNKNS